MFYNQKTVEAKLTCESCKQRYDVPKALPCGETICMRCEKALIQNNKHLKCPFCSSTHQLSHDQNELPIQQAIKNLLETKPNVELQDKINSLLLNLILRANNLKSENDDTLKIYCEFLKNEIDIETESRINKLNDVRDKLHKEINDYEENLKFKTNSDTNKEFLNRTLDSLASLQCKQNNELVNDDYMKLKLTEASLKSFQYKLMHQMYKGKKLYIENIANETEMLKLGSKEFVINLDLDKFDRKHFSKFFFEFDMKNNDIREVYLSNASDSSVVLAFKYYNKQLNKLNTDLYVYDLELLILKARLHLDFHVELIDTSANEVILVFLNQDETMGMNLYDLNFNLLNTLSFFNFMPKSVKFGNKLIYLVSTNQVELTLHIFDLSLKKIKVIGPIHGIENFYSLICIYDSIIIFSENTNTKLYVYCEKRNHLIKTLFINTSSSAIYIDPLFRLHQLHRRSRKFTVLDLDIQDDDHLILYDDTLDTGSHYFESFCITNDGRLVVLDNINESNVLFIFS